MKKFLLWITMLILVLITSCSNNTFSEDYWIMDTYCTVTLYDNISNETAELVKNTLKECEKNLFLDGESKSFFAQTDHSEIAIQNDIYEMLKICLELSELSDGKFDITIAPLTELWDIQNRTEPPKQEEIEETKKRVGYKALTLNKESLNISIKNFGIDIGAVGKGYAGDKTAESLRQNGYTAGILNLGGNVTVFGENPNKESGYFTIGIKDPINNASVFASVNVKNTNVVTAGGYERFFEYNGVKYHHILDPHTGYPADNGIISATVICQNGIVADALATTLYVSGTEKGIEILDLLKNNYPEIAAILYTDEGNIITYNIKDYNFLTYDFCGEIINYD